MLPISVLKFGGSSLKDAAFINQAVDIIAELQQEAQPVVVVSAIGGVTDRLLELADSDEKQAQPVLDELRRFHLNLLTELGGDDHSGQSGLPQLFDELDALFGNAEERAKSPAAWRDHLLSFGERASVRIVSAALNAHGIAASYHESHHFITTDATHGEANVLREESREAIRKAVNPAKDVPVITGFIGATEKGAITTLGRSGSDYTASLVADSLEADHLEIWTDVNGVLTADPDKVPEAESIEALNFEDIAELATHGVGVIHSKTIQPIRNRDITLQIRNSYDRTHPGTRIHRTIAPNGSFRSLILSGPFICLQVDGRHAPQLNRLIEEKASPSSETDTYSYWQDGPSEKAHFLLSLSLHHQLRQVIAEWSAGQHVDIDQHEDIYKLKKFTNALQQSDEPISKLLEILREKGIRPISINRNHRQRYVSLLLPKKEAFEAARAVNRRWKTDKKPVSIFIAGTGAVGGTLIEQLKKVDHPKYDIQTIGSCDSASVHWEDKTTTTEWPDILNRLKDHASPDIIFVDATGSEQVAKLYPELFEAGIHVVTPSKLANTFEQSFYDRLRKTAGGSSFRYETTVGAGLPVLSTINDLQASGDTVTKISGVVSGTMTYLFDQLQEGIPFSKAIVQAREEGYAEPDPRDDLSGEDVARKFLTLAREIGWKIEREELQVQSLIPEELDSVDADTFLQQLPEFDDYWSDKMEDALGNGHTLRYTGQLANGEITIGVQEVSQKTPLGQLRGTDNLIRIESRRYHQTPIIIQGPGAGKEVTAAGVLTDIIKTAGTLK
jgi:aspartokinase/homoserine dehydrogenase 1